MTTITILTAADSDFATFVSDVVDNYTGFEQGTDAYSVVRQIDPTHADKITVHGTGFTYFFGFPSGGTGTSLTLSHNGVDFLRADGFSLPFTDVAAAAADSPEAVVALFGNVSFIGNIGKDVATLGAGNDTFKGGLGNDVFDGGLGVDTASYSDKTGAVVVTLNGSTNATVKVGGIAEDTIKNIENIVGGSGSDILTGDAQANKFLGGSGNDKLFGGTGNDLLIGGSGSDYLSAGTGLDTASYAGASSGVTVSLVSPGSNTNDAAGDTFNSVENLTGSDFVDSLTGNTAINVINGGKGSDKLFGLDGNDTLIGGGGGDVLNGGVGADTASYATATAGVTASLANPAINSGDAAGDSYVSIENLTGSGFNDVLTGNNSNNVISGGNGVDTINGKIGIDKTTGGGGADAFVFDTTPNSTTNYDHVTDFVHAQDKIRLDHDIFAALPTGALSSAAFKDISSAAEDANDRILYKHTNGALYYDADGAGGVAAQLFAVLDNHPAVITSADFLVIV